MKKFAVSALAVAALAGAAFGQGQTTDQVQLQLRLVPQTGLPADAGGVVDHVGDQHPDTLTGAGQVFRFEVQYRLVDLNTGDAFFPAGLTAGNLRITASGGTGNGRLERALISRFEAQQAGSTPPTSPDTSGNPTGPFLGATGLHRPFRGGIPGPAPNNDNPANGIFSGDNLEIFGTTPLSLSQSDQNEDGAWYGLYSFNFVSGSSAGPDNITLTVAFDADPTTGNAFGFFTDGDPVPVTSPNATGDTATIVVPAPGALALLGLGGLVAGRRRRA